MQAWIETTVDEELSKPARIFLFSPELLMDDLPTGLAGEIGSLGGTLTRLKSIADSLGIGGTKEEEEEILDEVAAEKALVKFRGPRAKVVFNGMNFFLDQQQQQQQQQQWALFALL